MREPMPEIVVLTKAITLVAEAREYVVRNAPATARTGHAVNKLSAALRDLHAMSEQFKAQGRRDGD